MQPGDIGWIPPVGAETPAVGGEEGRKTAMLFGHILRDTRLVGVDLINSFRRGRRGS